MSDNPIIKAWLAASCEERKGALAELVKHYGAERLKHSVDVCADEEDETRG